MPEDKDRSEALFASTQQFLDAWTEFYGDSPEEDSPREIFFNDLDAMISILRDVQRRNQDERLDRKLVAFIKEADQFRSLLSEVSDAFDSLGEAAAKMGKPEPLSELLPLEPIADLMKLAGMEKDQICRTYGFVDRDKNPMHHLVDMELKNPGSVIGPAAKGKGLIDGKDWQDPREIDRDKKYGPDWRKRVAAPVERRSRKKSHRSAGDTIRAKLNGEKPRGCPETPRQLWEQGVSIEQSSRMLDSDEWSLDAVKAQWSEWDGERAEIQKQARIREAREALKAAEES